MASVDLQAIRTAAAPLLAYLPATAWLPHALVRKPDGNLDKPPCMGARTNAPETWFTLEAALGHLTGRNEVAGIGFAIVRGLIAYDFDHCRDEITGELADEVQVELETLNSYAYVTPSKTGIRVVGTNSAAWAILPGKFTRWLPGGHKIEIFVGPVNFYNTFTADIIEGYDTLRDISTETTDHIQGLDDGRKGSNGSAVHLSNPDPQRSIAAIRAALAIIPNEVEDWDEWCRIGMAVWRSSGGSGAGLDAWHDWSSKHACYDPARCDERWQHWFISPPTKIGFGTLYHEARKIRPLFVPPFDVSDTGSDSSGGTEQQKRQDKGQDSLPPILSSRAFMDTFTAPDYLVDGIIQRSRLHALTSPTGHGKTALAIYFGCMIAEGRNIGAIEVSQGGVLFLAGENPDDVCGRLFAACQEYGLDPDKLAFHVMPGNFPLDADAAELLKQKIDATGLEFALIIGDSAAAYFPGDDENSNTQMGAYARHWRVLTTCNGRPGVLALAHPVKNADRDTMAPRGGGAFLAELDVNLTGWAEGERTTTTVHWFGKIRGVDFQPVVFALKPVTLAEKRDAKGRPFISVVALLQTSEAAEQVAIQNLTNENVVLELLRRHPGISVRNIAMNAGWVNLAGKPNPGRVQRLLVNLKKDKLVKLWRGKWQITKLGKDELAGKTGGEND